ncbi:histidine phosphatase superfamily [Gymnopilus junonius]|uniref:Histidine phosphatase superfamily n=1 Tax=Gymnopilus junonius TaxID=109634 RepID=A0A9P5TU31_GYMJU|nr:histidine phosphatase superfamily [Gymnopilus junonius]
MTPTGKSATPGTTKPIARIYLVRHGETQENRDGVIQGQMDTMLNEMGQEQARKVGERFREVKIDRLFSSDLKRARRTAEEILAYHPEVLLEEQPALRERVGCFAEGSLMMATDPTVETHVDFGARVVGWWNQQILGHILSKSKNLPTTVVVTTHGGFITTLVRELIGSRKAECGDGVIVWKCFNSSVSVIEVGENRRGTVVSFGDVSHLNVADIALHSIH